MLRYAAMNMSHEVKQALITVKRELAMIKVLDELIPVAQQIRGLISVRISFNLFYYYILTYLYRSLKKLSNIFLHMLSQSLLHLRKPTPSSISWKKRRLCACAKVKYYLSRTYINNVIIVEDITSSIISTLSTILPPDQLIPLAQLTRTLKDKVADKIPTKK